MTTIVLWLLAASIFVLSFVADTSAFTALRRADVQAILAITVILSFLVDPWVGLLLSLSLLVMLHRLQSASIAYVDGSRPPRGTARGYGYGAIGELSAGLITENGLHDIQSNVFNPIDYERGMVGIKGVYGEPVYGAQGLVAKGDNVLPGWEGAVGSPITG
jgi:hypothetical protein